MRIRTRLLLLLPLLAAGLARAQYFMPASETSAIARDYLREKQFRVIYPWASDSLARMVMANALKYAPLSSLGVESRARFPIVLRMQNASPNGRVVWTPSRMELHALTGGEESIPSPWVSHLVAHEIRHYQQMAALRQGTLWGASFLLGQHAVAIGAALSPQWFLEGDAMYNESVLSGFGRASSAKTYQCYRADLLSNSKLSYDEYLNRSFRYFVPNHYSFGSLMVEYGVHTHGEHLWPRVLSYTARYPFTLFPFHFALKRYTRSSRHQMFNSAMRTIDSLYTANYDTNLDPEPQERKQWQSQRYPYRLPGTETRVYWQLDWYHILKCYIEEEGNRTGKEIFTPYLLEGKVRYSANWATFTQLNPSPFWKSSVSRDVWLLDLLSGEGSRLTHGENMVSPVLSTSNRSIAAIQITPEGLNKLVKFSLDSGAITRQADLPEPIEMRELANIPGEDATLIRAVNGQGAYLLRYTWAKGRIDTIFPPSRIDMSNVTTDGQYVFFTATYRYAQRVFRIPLAPSPPERIELLQIPSYGIEDVTVSPSKGICFVDYTINGYRAREVDSVVCTPVSSPVGGSRLFPMPQPPPESVEQVVESKARRYWSLAQAIRVHSWYPMYLLPTTDITALQRAKLGMTLCSQNDLGTLALGMGYFYDRGHGAGFSIQWKGLLPFVQLYGSITHSNIYRNISSYPFLRENILDGGVRFYLPMGFYAGAVVLSVNPQLVFAGNSRPLIDSQRHRVSDGEFAFSYGFTASVLRRKAIRERYPRYGIALAAYQRLSLHPRQTFGNLLTAHAQIFLPGILPAHSFRLSGSYAAQGESAYLRPYSYTNSDFQYTAPAWLSRALGQRLGRVAYSLPLGYPDWNLGSWVYFKRFSTDFWFQWQQLERKPHSWTDIRTVGLSLTQDIHLFRTQYPLSIGIRGAYSPWGDRLGRRSRDFWSVGFSLGVALPYRLGGIAPVLLF